LAKKRKSGGRHGGSKGRSEFVQCDECGQRVPEDKAKKVTRFVGLVDPVLARELRKAGTYLPRTRVIKYYCISCAVHHRVAKVRAREERHLA